MSGSIYRIIAIGVLALLTASFVTAAAILLSRGDGNAPIQIIGPSSGEVFTPVPPNNLTTSPPSTPLPDLRVYISGAVQNPGVYPVQPGDRLVDALKAAGGANPDAELTAVNLAQRVQDEGYYYIPRVGETPHPLPQFPGEPTSDAIPNDFGGAGPNNELIDLNTASLDALMTLPGIGPVKAQAIVDYREQHGPFASIEGLTAVSGIGPATFEKIRDLVTVKLQ
jgi:competence protein ComEA